MSTYLASLTHPSAGLLQFLVSENPMGWPRDVAIAMEEDLVSPGVDGKRFRVMQYQETPFQLTTYVDADTYPAAILIGQKYLQCKTGQPVTLTVTMDGVQFVYRNVHVNAIDPIPSPGTVVMPGLSSSPLAHCVAVWQLELMDTTTSGQAN